MFKKTKQNFRFDWFCEEEWYCEVVCSALILQHSRIHNPKRIRTFSPLLIFDCKLGNCFLFVCCTSHFLFFINSISPNVPNVGRVRHFLKHFRQLIFALLVVHCSSASSTKINFLKFDLYFLCYYKLQTTNFSLKLLLRCFAFWFAF